MNEPPISAATAVLAAAPGPRDQPALAPQAVPALAPAALSLHIDRVVLEGFAFGMRDRGLLQAALQAELTRLLSAHKPGSLSLSDAAVPVWLAGGLRLDGDPDAVRLGRAIAQSLHARIVS